MKDINRLKNYREKYKRYFNINFDQRYVIHHIDLDRTNNDISNLLLLPRELHEKYHLILNALSVCPEKPKADGFLDVRLSNIEMTNYSFVLFEMLPEVIKECQKWLALKREKYSPAAIKLILKGEV